MRSESNAQRLGSFVKIIIALSQNKKECIVGKYKKIDKQRDRLNQVITYITCNINRHITLNEIALHTGMNRASF